MILFYDTETYSETPIANGSHAYAEDPFAEILIESWAIDDGPVQVADKTAGEDGPFDVFDPEDFDAIVMHNGGLFDRIVNKLVRNLEIPVHLIHDTQVQARSHGLPGALEKLCAIFGVPEELMKHSGGKKLIQRFCKPQPKSFKIRRCNASTHPKEWAEFLSYAGGDIHAMRYLYRKMPRWNYPNREHPLWCLDQKINDRGFKVDLDLAHAAIDMVNEIKDETDEQTQLDTDGRVRSSQQRDALLQELLLEHGVRLPDLQATTIERRMEDPDLPDVVKELLGQRLLTSSTSTAKYKAVIRSASSDGRLRGSLLFSGAGRTKRWSGKLFQPQNLPRPDMPVEDVLKAITAMKAGSGAIMLDEPMRAAWNALRGLIVADEGKKLVQADLGQIEARVLPWLAGGPMAKLEAFYAFDNGTGPDLYIVEAARILKCSPEEITKALRQMYGKVPFLALGYGGSSNAFLAMAQSLGMRELPPLHEVQEIVRAWRAANHEIASFDKDDPGFWLKLENAARQATLNPNMTFEAGEHIRFERWKEWLRMELPSGGFLSYAHPHIGDHPHGGPNSICFFGVNNYTRKWEQLYTYGGKLSADCLGADTQVLTPSGWKRITKIAATDLLWDGEDWVSHKGVIQKGFAQTNRLDGVAMTADHLVLTTKGWRSASSCEGHHRAEVRLPDSVKLSRFGWAQVALAGTLRLWCRGYSAGVRDGERQDQILRMQTGRADLKIADHPRHVIFSAVWNMEGDARSLSSRDGPCVSQLWWAGHRSVSRVAQLFRDVLARYAERLSAASLYRAARQQSGLFQEQLLLGHGPATGTKHPGKSDHRYALGRDDGVRSFGSFRHRGDHLALPFGNWSRKSHALHSTQPYEPVLDILNVGPRNRFTVRGQSGPMLVHNCTQGTAREILAHNLQHIEDQGFPIVLTCHDEIITEPPNDPAFSVEKLVAALIRRPPWLDERMPLAADGFEADRYRKED